jgi:N-acetylglucosamine-6-sulfatase
MTHAGGTRHRGVRARLRAALVAVAAVSLTATLWSEFPAIGSIVRGTSAPTGAARTATTSSDRPNIVVVMADDLRTDDLRFMPAVRRLVRDKGLEFRNSFSPYPLCCPARASFLTGRYAHNHHVYSHTAPWGFGAFDDTRTLATSLQDSGYNTGFIGKYLNGYGAQPSLVTGRSSFRYVPPGWTDWYGAVGRPPNSGYSSGGPYNYFHTLFNVNGRIDDSYRGRYQTPVLGEFASKLVTKYHAAERPFFLYVSSVAPHFGGSREADDPRPVRRANGTTIAIKTPARPRWVRGRFDSLVGRAPGKPLDGSPSEADVSDKPGEIRRLSEPNPAEWAAVRESTRQRGEAEYVLDQQVAKLVAKLRATGEYADTVFVFTSDNGYFLGEHRIRQGKIKPHEPSLRVPLLIAGRGIPHGLRFDPVTTPGLTATIMDLAGARAPFPADGVSVVPSIRRGDLGWTVPVVTEGRERAAAFSGDYRTTIGIRTGRWKYVRYGDGSEELYDLDSDPNELRGLQHDPARQTVLAQLREVWSTYKDCMGPDCRAKLPADLQRSPEQTATGTRKQSRGVHARYGYWR